MVVTWDTPVAQAPGGPRPCIWEALPITHLAPWDVAGVGLLSSRHWTHVLNSEAEEKHIEGTVCKCDEHNV